MIPRNFPVGNVQLSKYLGRVIRGNPISRPIPLMAPYSGPVPKWDGKMPFANVRETLQAREGGALRQFLAARNHPTELRTQQAPQLSTQSLPPEVMTEPKVQTGGGTVRDANVPKAAENSSDKMRKIALDPLLLSSLAGSVLVLEILARLGFSPIPEKYKIPHPFKLLAPKKAAYEKKEASLRKKLMAGLLGAGLVTGGAAGGLAVQRGLLRARPKIQVPDPKWHTRPVEHGFHIEGWQYKTPGPMSPRTEGEMGRWLDTQRRVGAPIYRETMKPFMKEHRELAAERLKL